MATLGAGQAPWAAQQSRIRLQCSRRVRPQGREDPLGEARRPTAVLSPGEPHGPRGLAGCRPRELGSQSAGHARGGRAHTHVRRKGERAPAVLERCCRIERAKAAGVACSRDARRPASWRVAGGGVQTSRRRGAQQVVLRSLKSIPSEKRQPRPLEAEREPALVSNLHLRGDGAAQKGRGLQSRGRSEARLQRR